MEQNFYPKRNSLTSNIPENLPDYTKPVYNTMSFDGLIKRLIEAELSIRYKNVS